RFYDFANSQKTTNFRSTAPLKPIQAYHKPIHCHQPFSPNALHYPNSPLPHSNFDALHNPTITPPLAPFLPISSPQPSRLLSNHTPFYSFTFLRFCKFTENNKLPINRPIKAYYKPIQAYSLPHQPFSPNALHYPNSPLPHSNFDALHNPTITPPLAPFLPKRPTTLTALDQPHPLLQFHVFTILQIHRKQQTSDQLPH
ncbi:hypothetical protein, partial [Bartonella sp. AA168HLJHH]|uniref:hypothetical protein n=1 Tax=Bartonella sp. AA168HLJHH TaxID=3243427 RepID=UPI0035D04ED1